MESETLLAENAPVSVSQELFECLKASQDLESVRQRTHPLVIPARKGRNITKNTSFDLWKNAGLNSFAQCSSDGDLVEYRRGANHGEAREHDGL